MKALRSIWRRMSGALTGYRREDDLANEIEFHLRMQTDDYVRAGMSPEEAHRAARLKFGGLESVKEAYRDRRGLPVLEAFARDIRYGLRMLAKSPGFTAVAVVTLAFGIGLCSSLFSILNGVVLRPLPGVPDPEQLVAIRGFCTYPRFERHRTESDFAVNVAAFIGPVAFGVASAGADHSRPERVFGQIVSPEYFSTLGVEPSQGRFFDPTIDRFGDAPVVVVSEHFWRTRLQAEPRAIGSSLRVNGQLATIVGVGPEGFHGVFPSQPAAIFVPVTANPAIAPELRDDILYRTDDPAFRIVLRLAPEVAASNAASALTIQAQRMEAEKAASEQNQNRRREHVRIMSAGNVLPLAEEQRLAIVGFYGSLLALLITITCASLAGLVLVKGRARRKEIATRLALGANRARLVRQLLTESLVLAILGGAAGLAAAYGLTSLLSRTTADVTLIPATVRLTPDAGVAVFTFAVSALAGVGFALLPAIRSTRPDLMSGLKDMATATEGGGYRFIGLRNLLVVCQIAAALALLQIMGVLIVGTLRDASRSPGFDPSGLYLFSLDPLRDGFKIDEAETLITTLPGRLMDLIGVESVTLADRIPLGDVVPNANVSVPSNNSSGQEDVYSVAVQSIGSGFFETLGVPVLLGREFGERDLLSDYGPDATVPVIINHISAANLFGESLSLGRTIRRDDTVLQVIGIVRYGRPAFLMNEPVPTIFLPVSRSNSEGVSVQETTVVMRSQGDLDFAGITAEVDAVDGRLTIFNAQSMREHLAKLDSTRNKVMALNTSMGMFGLILTCVGLAGVTAQSVQQRRKEIGIRMALGSSPSQVVRLVMREGLAMILVGSAVGFAVAYLGSRLAASASSQFAGLLVLIGNDPVLILGLPLCLVLPTVLACYIPARRSVTINPLVALRTD